MKILICADEAQQSEIKNDIFPQDSNVFFVDSLPDDVSGYDAYFILRDSCKNEFYKIEEKVLLKDKPVFINEVVRTLSELNAPENMIRINGWRGFLQRPVWEAAGNVNDVARQAMKELGREIINVKDVPGLVAASVVSMIINEAFFARKEEISSEEQIDLAMKLGTNYPLGPFEWMQKVGEQNVYDLLVRLSRDNKRYTPSFEHKRS